MLSRRCYLEATAMMKQRRKLSKEKQLLLSKKLAPKDESYAYDM